MEGAADDRTMCQREELANAICEYRDVFSSGPTDMERIGLIKHAIDTGGPKTYSSATQTFANCHTRDRARRAAKDAGLRHDRAVSE